MLALIESYRAKLLSPKNWLQNIMAGLIVGVVALPLAMAFAIASGAKPEQGLYTAIIAGIVVAIFGGSRVQVAGPTGAFVVILAGITARYGINGLQVATLLAGFILIFMSLIRLGSVIKYIPDPVIVGFTAGIGFIIFVGEWKDFFGLTAHLPIDARFYQKLRELIYALPHLQPTTTGLAILSLLLVLITPKLIKRIPGPLVAMVVVTALQSTFHFDSVVTLGSAFGGIPEKLPSLQWPHATWNQMMDLMGAAFTIALLGAIESLLSATAADSLAGTRHNSNQELIGQGLANIIAPLFGGFAATGAIARTATNIRNGGNSPIAALVHSGLLILVIVLLAPLAANIPLCTLAAILFVVAYNMSDIPHVIFLLKRAPRSDVIVLVITFLLTVLVNLVVAVNIGVILAMLFFIRTMTKTVNVTKHTPAELTHPDLPQDVIVYSIQGPLFFGVAEKIERALMITHTEPSTIIFRLADVPFMDITGLQTFEELLLNYAKRKVKIYLCEANITLTRKMTKVGLLQHVSENLVFGTLTEVLEKVKST